ncbi:hypothetical protein [Roseivivax sediminis]|uniref:Lipoprotein n=1 Tax=Roseivivax sediminis TaxID=936889 RepID=A0A1I2BNS6_9RHOB|nr:hypothetical protein [Roseivivax sediminis]SFE57802.1 hypothetical protein SAMN04515678_111127 [Roseivivax sediminis]
MRRLSLAFLLVLAACATPLERCVSQAGARVAAAEDELRELERTLARGYAVEIDVRTVPVFTTCYYGKHGRRPCVADRVQRFPRRVPVDLTEVRRRAEEIRASLPDMREAAQAGAAQCRTLHADSLAPQD